MAYAVLGESEARSRLDIVVKQRRLTPFVGREAEMAVLRERWEQVKEGMGQVVLIHGESGLGSPVSCRGSPNILLVSPYPLRVSLFSLSSAQRLVSDH